MTSISYVPVQWTYFAQFLPSSLIQMLWEEIKQRAEVGHTNTALPYESYCEKLFDTMASALIPSCQSRRIASEDMEILVSQALSQAEYSYRGNQRHRHRPFEQHLVESVLTEVDLAINISRWKELIAHETSA